MENNDIGYYEDPINSTNLKRARTTRSIRSWEFSRSLDSLEALNPEMGKIDYPGLYILFEGNDKVYIGEAKSLIKRLETHTKSPEEKIKNWEKVIIINDGRPATQSDFNDGVVRMALELYLIDLFKTNRYKVVAQGEPQSLNSIQKYMVESLKKELFFFLAKKGIINKQIEHSDEREVFSDEVKKILIKNGKKIEKWKEKE